MAQQGAGERRDRGARPLGVVVEILGHGDDVRPRRLQAVELRGDLEQRAGRCRGLEAAHVGRLPRTVEDPTGGAGRPRPALPARLRSSSIDGVSKRPACQACPAASSVAGAARVEGERLARLAARTASSAASSRAVSPRLAVPISVSIAMSSSGPAAGSAAYFKKRSITTSSSPCSSGTGASTPILPRDRRDDTRPAGLGAASRRKAVKVGVQGRQSFGVTAVGRIAFGEARMTHTRCRGRRPPGGDPERPELAGAKGGRCRPCPATDPAAVVATRRETGRRQLLGRRSGLRADRRKCRHSSHALTPYHQRAASSRFPVPVGRVREEVPHDAGGVGHLPTPTRRPSLPPLRSGRRRGKSSGVGSGGRVSGDCRAMTAGAGRVGCGSAGTRPSGQHRRQGLERHARRRFAVVNPFSGRASSADGAMPGLVEDLAGRVGGSHTRRSQIACTPGSVSDLNTAMIACFFEATSSRRGAVRARRHPEPLVSDRRDGATFAVQLEEASPVPPPGRTSPPPARQESPGQRSE